MSVKSLVVCDYGVMIQYWFHRLCARDAHQLFQRLESHAIDYILEVKVKLEQQLTNGHTTPDQAKAFMSLLLEEYASVCTSSKILSDIFKQLVSRRTLRGFMALISRLNMVIRQSTEASIVMMVELILCLFALV